MEGWDQTLIPTNNSVIFVEKKIQQQFIYTKKLIHFLYFTKIKKKKHKNMLKK